MTVLVIELATTGFYRSSVLSVAAIKIAVDWNLKKVDRLDTFVRHYHPVEKWNPHAQAVNGLSAKEIERLRIGAEYPAYFKDDHGLTNFACEAEFAVAHNAKFDSSFANLQIPWICTMKLCGGKLADAARLRGIVIEQSQLHEALYDAEVCFLLFKHCFLIEKPNTFDELWTSIMARIKH